MISAQYYDGKTETVVYGDPEGVTQEFMSILVAMTSRASDPDGFVEYACRYMRSDVFARRVKEAAQK